MSTAPGWPKVCDDDPYSDESLYGFAHFWLQQHLPQRGYTHQYEVDLLARSAGVRTSPDGIVELTGESIEDLLWLVREHQDRAGHDALNKIFSDLATRDEEPPRPLMDYMANEAPHFKRAKQRPRGEWLQNAAIAAVMVRMVDFSDWQKSERKASDIVSEVLNKEFSMLKSPAAVRRIYERDKQQGIAFFIGEKKYKAHFDTSP